MDGVVSDTQKLHARVESELLAQLGVAISPEEITRRFAGMSLTQQFGELLWGKRAHYDMQLVEKEKWRRMADLAKQGVDPVKGSVETLIELVYHFRLGLGSASVLPYVESVLHALDVRPLFESVVTGDMVAQGKPAPDIFLRVARELHIPPSRCVVIEDGKSGMIAAARAGMKCIALVPQISDEYPTQHQICSLYELNQGYIRSVLAVG